MHERKRLGAVEYGIVLAILLVIALVGFLEGVAVGLVLTVVLFVVSYSRIDPVRYAATGVDLRSRVRRSPAEDQALVASGEGLLVMQLQGFLFFGTTARVLERVEAAWGGGRVAVAVLDLSRVTGTDASGLTTLRTLAARAEANGSELWLAEVPGTVAAALARAGGGDGARRFPTVDAALEEWESRVLAGRAAAHPAAAPAEARAEDSEEDRQEREELPPDAPEVWPAVVPYLERVELRAGENLFAQGEAAGSLYLVAAGRLSTLRLRPGHEPERLETMGPGHAVGEVGLLTGEPRSATVRADEPSVVFRLTREALERMLRDDPRAAAGLFEWLGRRMAGRIGQLVSTVDALRR